MSSGLPSLGAAIGILMLKSPSGAMIFSVMMKKVSN